MAAIIEKHGEKVYLVIPHEALAQLGWVAGDVLDLTIEAGSLRLTRSISKRALAMALARRAFVKYRETFEALAKT